LASDKVAMVLRSAHIGYPRVPELRRVGMRGWL
jgi:hypothetical protein